MNAFPFRALALVLSLASTGLAAQPALRAPPSFSVVFEDCTEFAGLGPLAAAQIQGLVAPGFTPASFRPGTDGVVAADAENRMLAEQLMDKPGAVSFPATATVNTICKAALARPLSASITLSENVASAPGKGCDVGHDLDTRPGVASLSDGRGAQAMTTESTPQSKTPPTGAASSNSFSCSFC